MGKPLSESGAKLYEYSDALSAKNADSGHMVDNGELVRQYSNHIALYKAYRKQIRTIGARDGLELTLSVDEVDTLFKDWERKRAAMPNFRVEQFASDYIDDVRTLYQLCRAKQFPEIDRELCANEYKKERARNEISPSPFVASYSPGLNSGLSGSHRSNADSLISEVNFHTLQLNSI